jgi:hypothetical protein
MSLMEKAGFALQHSISHSAQRIPSYCDRILWRSASFLENHLAQVEFASVPQCTSSDHTPVRAVFDVRLHTPVVAELKAPSPLTLVFSGLKMSNIPRLDLLSESDPYIVFHTNPPGLLASAYKSSVKWNKKNAVWNQGDLPELILNVSSPSDLARIDLIMTVWDSDPLMSDEFIGMCSISLSALTTFENGYSEFSETLTQHTVKTATTLEGGLGLWTVGRSQKDCVLS